LSAFAEQLQITYISLTL